MQNDWVTFPHGNEHIIKAIVINNSGVDYAEDGFYKEAIVEYTKAIKLNPKEVVFYENRGDSYTKLGMKKEATEDFKKVRELKN